MNARVRRRSAERMHASAGTRVLVACTVGLAVAAGIVATGAWQIAVLAGWAAAMIVYVGWVWLAVAHLDADATRRIAMTEDSSRAAADVVLILANVVNLVGVGLALVEAADEDLLVAGLINGAVVASVSLSWTAIHTVFALRYARLYYDQGGGIDFGDGVTPDYADFAYLSFTLGMTYQVSDTRLTGRVMRRTALRHALLSYLFGVFIVATTLNVVAGLFRG